MVWVFHHGDTEARRKALTLQRPNQNLDHREHGEALFTTETQSHGENLEGGKHQKD